MGANLATIADHAALAIARLAQQYRDQPNIEGLINALAAEVQEVEDAFWTLFTLRSVAVAQGAQLDILGATVGRRRAGATDDEYRLRIQAQIKTNLSNGTVEEIYDVFRTLLPAAVLVLREDFPASLVLQVSSTAIPSSLVWLFSDFLRACRGGGIYGILEWLQGTDANAFWTERATMLTAPAGAVGSEAPIDGNTLYAYRLDALDGSLITYDSNGAHGLSNVIPGSSVQCQVVTGTVGNAIDCRGSSSLRRVDSAMAAAIIGALVDTVAAGATVCFWFKFAGVYPGNTDHLLLTIGDGSTNSYYTWQIDCYRSSISPSVLWDIALNQMTNHLGPGYETILTTGGKVPTNVWTHLGIRRRYVSGTWHVDIVINGVQVKTQATTAMDVGGTYNTVCLGSSATGSFFMAMAAFDDLRFYKTALSDADLLSIYNNGLSAGSNVLTVGDTSGFPAAGNLVLDKGLAAEETVAYTSKTGTQFNLSGTTVHGHLVNSEVSDPTSSGLGFGDSSNAAVGGELAGAVNV